MTSGGWHSQEQRHGRHRRGAPGAAWTPAVRPADARAAHARSDGVLAFRPAEIYPAQAWPTSEVLTRRPGWPVDPEPEVPAARTPADAPAWPTAAASPGSRRSSRAVDDGAPPSFPRESIAGREVPAPPRRSRHAARRGTAASPDMLADTVPMSGARNSRPESGVLLNPVVHPLPETPETGLRKFDLGTVPASVTPPRSWRRAAWFAVGTSAAVVLGLAVATAELMGRHAEDGSLIDALPAYPSGPLTLAPLPHETTTSDGPDTAGPRPTGPSSEPSASASAGSTPTSRPDDTPRDTVTGSTTGEESVVLTEGPGEGTVSSSTTTAGKPTRQTVGPAPVTPTNPQKMGDLTESYFQLVTTDPAAAHALTTGGMARKGAAGIQARYAGVERVEVQEITIDRNQATTTSRVRVVHEDGTETIEQRTLTFTWGGDPKITDDSITA